MGATPAGRHRESTTVGQGVMFTVGTAVYKRDPALKQRNGEEEGMAERSGSGLT